MPFLHFLRSRAAGITAWLALVLCACLARAQSPQVPIAGSSIPQFQQALPLLSVSPGGTINTLFGNQPITLRMCEFQSRILPPGFVPPAGSKYSGSTWVWGYLPDTSNVGCAGLISEYSKGTGVLDTFTGPVLVSQRNSPTEMTFINDLGTTATTHVQFYKYSTDQTLHWADPLGGEMNLCNMMGGIPAFGSSCAQNYAGPIPAVVHLHGGEVPPEIDGGPDAWFTSDGAYRGHGYYSQPGAPANGAIYSYNNTQEASPIWFHDHTLGATRLNVYAGLAGAYFITDPNLALPSNLLPLTEVVPIVLQDRMFDSDGQLFFPADTAAGMVWTPNAEHPYWVPEFVGDTIVVNGKAWPYLNVQARRYRFLFLNGSNARTYELFLVNPTTKAMGPVLWQIGTDGGYLDAPVKIDPNGAKGTLQKLTLMPGERADIIIDFAGLPAGTTLILKNTGRTPYPKGAAPQGTTLGQVMQFRVQAAAGVDASYNPASGTPLRSPGQTIVRLVNGNGTLAASVAPAKTRQVTLNEVLAPAATAINPVTGLLTAYPGGPLEILVNNTKWSGGSDNATGTCARADFTAVTVGGITTCYSETPREGETEVWEIVNLTADAHPMHLHLVQFQLLNRQAFNVNQYNIVYGAAFPSKLYQPAFGPPLDYNLAQNCSPAYSNVIGGNPCVDGFLQGPVQLPAGNELGWKDTVMVPPGTVTRIAVRFAPTDLPVSAASANLFYPFDPSDGLHHGYVWHCHIIDHEDNEMMRPDLIQLNPAAPAPSERRLHAGIDY